MPAVTPEIFDRICERLAEGESLRAACRELGLAESTARAYVNDNPEAFAQYTRARELQADAHFDDVIDIANEARRGEIDPQSARVAIDAKKWTAGRMRPKLYGDKTTIEPPSGTSGEITIKWQNADN